MPINTSVRTCAITIDNTKVSGSANHTNFPVLLTEDNLPSEIFDADGSYPAKADGGDIRFSSDSAGTTELAREIVEFTRDNDPANGTCQIWVKVPTLDYDDDTVIYIWYNDSGASEPAADSTYGSEAVWSDYDGVWHLEEESGTRNDATANGNDLSDNNTVTYGSAAIGNGADFELSTSEFLNRAYANLSGLKPNSNVTFSGWFKMETFASSGVYTLFSRWGATANNNAYLLRVTNIGGASTTFYFNFREGTSNKDAHTASSLHLSTDTLYHFQFSIDFSVPESRLIINGVNRGTGTPNATSINTGAEEFCLGRASNNVSYFDGLMDEMRQYNAFRSDDWAITEYNNQSSPSTFASAGTPTGGIIISSNFFQLF
jgi:hypothetical protein